MKKCLWSLSALLTAFVLVVVPLSVQTSDVKASNTATFSKAYGPDPGW
ncbi:hypothetical protein ACQCN2_18200 [Brevibacillus ginsengisoli]